MARSNSKLNFHKAITHIFSKNLACWQVYNMAPCVRRSMSWQTLLGMPGAVSKRYGKPSWNKTKDVRIWKSWWLVAGIANRMFGLMIFAYHMPLLLYTFVTFLAGFWKEHLPQQLLSNLNLSLVADPCTIQFVLGHSINLSHSLGEHIVDEEQRQLQGPMERPWEATEDPEAKIVYHLDSRWQLCCCLLVAILFCPSHVFLSFYFYLLKCLSLNLLLVVATFQTDSFCKLTLESQLAHGIRSPLYFGHISKPNHYTYSVFMQSLTATHGYSTVQTQLVLQCSKSGERQTSLANAWNNVLKNLKKPWISQLWSSFTFWRLVHFAYILLCFFLHIFALSLFCNHEPCLKSMQDYCCSFSDLDALKNGIFQVPWLAVAKGRSKQHIMAIYGNVEQAICHISSQIFVCFSFCPWVVTWLLTFFRYLVMHHAPCTWGKQRPAWRVKEIACKPSWSWSQENQETTERTLRL